MMPDAPAATLPPSARRGVFLLLGPPGSGKGTVATQLLEAGVIGRHVSMGELLRDAVERATDDPEEQAALSELLRAAHWHDDPVAEVRRALAQGQLIQNAWTSALLERALQDGDLRASRWALDGYPRRVGAAQHLLQTLRALEIPLLNVLHLQLPEAEVRQRLLNRGRADDTPESVEQRLVVYREEVLPAVAYLAAQLPENTVLDVDAWTPGLDASAGASELQRRVLHALAGAAP